MEQFRDILNQMINFFNESLPLEEAKMKAAKERNLTALEDCMMREQAVILKLKGLESKRETVMKEMGWEGKTFRQVIEVMPEEEKPEFQQLFDKLGRSISLFQSANETALDTIKINQRQVEKAIKSKDTKGIYNQNGNSLGESRPLTNRKV